MVELERNEILRPAEAGARLVALRLLDDARAACARLADPDDAEAIHDLRVALRRLRSTLAAYRSWLEPDTTRDALAEAGRLAGQAGAAREAEVELAWLRAQTDALRPAARGWVAIQIEALESRARDARQEASAELPARFAEFERALRAALETYRVRVASEGSSREPGFAAAAGSALQATARELEQSLERVSGPDDVAIEHEARLVAKRLRYLLEPVRRIGSDGPELLAALRTLQNLIGERHDRLLLSAQLRGLLERAALSNARARADAVAARDLRTERRLRARTAEHVALLLLQRAQEQSDALFAELAANWLGAKSAAFFARVSDFADALRQLDAANVEIERKYLLRALPDRVQGAEAIEIEQGYLPGSGPRERLRRSVGARGTRYTRTVKLGTGVVRAEFEEQLGQLEFERLWPGCADARLRKRRYRVPDGAIVWEIDEFLDRPLVLAEVELPTADFAVEIPDWLAPYLVREVTDESAFSNLRLACEPRSD
jgi:CYTH domain-containing protein/CHAD domain-containing protein